MDAVYHMPNIFVRYYKNTSLLSLCNNRVNNIELAPAELFSSSIFSVKDKFLNSGFVVVSTNCEHYNYLWNLQREVEVTVQYPLLRKVSVWTKRLFSKGYW